MTTQFNKLKIIYNDSFQKSRAEVKCENSLYKRLLTKSNSHLAFEPNEGNGIVVITKERRQIVAALNKIFDFFDRVFRAADFPFGLTKDSLTKLKQEARDLNISLTAVNDGLLADAKKTSSSYIDSDPITTDLMYADIVKISQNLLGFLNEEFANFFNISKDQLPDETKLIERGLDQAHQVQANFI